jgi:hypothetical protein
MRRRGPSQARRPLLRGRSGAAVNDDVGDPPICRAGLSRAEALELLGGTGVGLVVCTTTIARTRTPGFHLLVGEELVILTIATPGLDATVRAGGLVTYEAGSVDDAGETGWEASFTGAVRDVADPVPLGGGRAAGFGSEPGPGSRVLRLSLLHVTGQRFGHRGSRG